MEVAAVFTRRDPATVTTVSPDTKVAASADMLDYQDDIDVMILCGGSASDLPEMSPEIAKSFNIVDSFDTHATILEHLHKVDEPASAHGTSAIIGVGWDPGLFSLNRLLGESILPTGDTTSFWGEGLSQGHSEAVRGVKGVKDGVQYTVPIESQLQQARHGQSVHSDAGGRHKRVCYVVAEDENEQERIENEIVHMPHYFAEYDTTVHFISEDELRKNHSKMKHGGFVITSAETSPDQYHTVEFSADLDSNPEFTASVLVAYARAAAYYSKNGESGAKTVFDVPFSYLTPEPIDQVIKNLL